MSTEVRPISEADLKAITLLHIQNLQTAFQGNAGKNLLMLYYNNIMRGNGGKGYVAINNNKIAGFICGIWDRNYLRKMLIRNYWSQLAIWGFAQVLTKPIIALDILYRFFHNEHEPYVYSYELRPIVVDREFRGQNIASLLLYALVKDATDRGFHSIYLYTEENNTPALRFYEKSGFRIIGKTNRYRNSLILLSLELRFR